MVLLNELINEATERCRRLTDEAGAAAEEAEALMGRARKLGEAVSTETREALAALRDLAAQAGAARQAIEAADDAVRERMQRIRARVEELEEDADEVQQAVEAATAELDGVRERVASEMQDGAREAVQRLGELAQEAVEVEAEATSRTRDMLAETAGLRGAVDRLRAALPEDMLRLHGGLEDLEAAAEAAIDEVLQAFEDSMQAQIASFAELGQTVAEEHNRAVQAFAARFIEQAAGELRAALDPLRQATESMEQLADAGAQALVARGGEIGTVLAATATALDRINPALAAVARLA